MKKIIYWGLILSLVFSLGISGISFAQKGTTLRILTCDEPYVAAMADIIPEYEAKYGVKVEITSLSWMGVLEKSKLELSSGSSTYDIIHFDQWLAASFLTPDWLLPFGSFMNDPSLPALEPELFLPRLSEGYGIDAQKGLPIYVNCIVMAYRKDLFNDPSERADFLAKYGYALGVPVTWSQYEDVAEFFTRDTTGDGNIDFWGVSLSLSIGPAFDEWQVRYKTFKPIEGDKWILDKNNKPIFNNAKGYKALQDLVDFYERGFAPPGAFERSWGDVANPMIAGKCATGYTWGVTFRVFDDTEIGPNIGYASLPFYEIPNTNQGGWIMGINKKSKHPREAYRLMAWLISPENDLRMAKFGTGSPVRITSYQDEQLLAEIPLMKAMGDSYRYATFVPDIPEFEEVYTEISIAVQNAITGKETVKEALDGATSRLDKVMRRAGYY